MDKAEQHYMQLFNHAFAYRERLIKFAYYYLGDEYAAEDIVMDAYMYYWQNRDNIKTIEGGDLRPYILTIIKHKCLDYLKREKKKKEVLSQINDEAMWTLSININSLESLDPVHMYTKEYQSMVQDILNKMPDKTRDIFLMNRIDGLTYKEIARITNLSEKSIEYHMSRALQILKDNLPADFYLATLLFLDTILRN